MAVTDDPPVSAAHVCGSTDRRWYALPVTFRLASTTLLALSACASSIPKAEIDRCNSGMADGNDAFKPRQGAACRMIAARLAANEQPTEAVGYARKACAFEDPEGCEQYVALVRGHPSLSSEELPRARAMGERACSGLVVGDVGSEARLAICVRTAELYTDVAPRSPADAARLYARACKLGDRASCDQATKLGADVEAHPAAAAAKLPPQASPPSAPPPAPSASTPPLVACHPMRSCVVLDVQQRNRTEVLGQMQNHCDRAVLCTWCPAHADQVDKKACRSATLAPNESKAGREPGLWYDGYNALAYDCTDANDGRGCLGM